MFSSGLLFVILSTDQGAPFEMLQIHVLIVQHGRRQPRREWIEDSTSELLLHEWAESCSLWPQSLLNNEADPIEVALCLDRDSLARGFESHFIRRVIEQAHKSMWGAKVYVIVDDSAPLLSAASLTAGEGETPEWLEELLKYKIADILRWPMKRDTDYGKAFKRSANRIQQVLAAALDRHWKCLVQTPPQLSLEQESLLSPFLVDSFNELHDENCLIVIPEERQEDFVKRLKRRLQSASGFEIIIGFVDRISDPPEELEEFCKSKGYALVRFHGMLELYSFMHKLNPVRLEVSERHSIPVRMDGTRAFQSAMPPLLLVTHSYQPGDKLGCLMAATDTWELIKDLADDIATIHPAIDCAKLTNILEERNHLLAWIHIGHGEDDGLIRAGDGLPHPADDWLSCFGAYESSLALAVFSSCNSAAVAKRFAQSGARVAIGFTNRVHKKVCIEITKRVVTAALKTNGARDEILKAFTFGRKRLKSDDREAVPVAFWAC
jgi:hypothetical protein